MSYCLCFYINHIITKSGSSSAHYCDLPNATHPDTIGAMSITLYTLASVFVVSLISLVGAITISLNAELLKRSVFFLVSLAVGALFGDAIIHLIPETFELFANPVYASLSVIAGIFAFFVLEKFLHWHHHHDDCDEHEDCGIHPLGRIILFSDGLHNFLDGAIIGAAYLVSIEVGVATTLAVILHEIPQEIGDFGVLIHAGYSRTRALVVNFLSGLVAVLGALAALFLSNTVEYATPILIAVAAGSFLYIAGSDLVPELHKATTVRQSLIQLIGILLGISLMFALVLVE